MTSDPIKRDFIWLANCPAAGHRWRHIGGRNAGCDSHCSCSVPVYCCDDCRDCDYGDNDEAHEKIARCEDRQLRADERNPT